ncbi:MAG: hypothetical protein OXG83_17450 [Acidobacteria bacterium]|nr:hypothetical protein [Acidobacteriota bacterium]
MVRRSDRRRWAILTAALGIASGFATAGLTLIWDHYGPERVVAALRDLQPVLEVLVLPVGVVLAISGLLWLGGILYHLDQWRGEAAAEKWEAIGRSGDEFFATQKRDGLPSACALGKFPVQVGKYAKRIALESDDGVVSWSKASVVQAYRLAEIFRQYGYVRGRLRVLKERKELPSRPASRL